MKSIIPRNESAAELRRIFRRCENALQRTNSLKAVRQLYRAMQRIEMELDLRAKFGVPLPRVK